MKGNKILYAGIAILILGIGFAVGTYAYYQTTITGTATGTVLAWTCTANNQSSAFTISLGSLYPGVSNSKNIVVTSAITSSYTVKFDNFLHIGAGSYHPNLKLYTTNTFTSANEITDGETLPAVNISTNGGTATTTFWYNWPYGAAAETYDADPVSFRVTLTCTQT